MKKAKICYICKETFENKHAKDNKYPKFSNYCLYTGEYRGATHSICNFKYSVPKEISIVLHNGSNNDYHFIIKELAEKFEGKCTCLRENTRKYLTFSVPREKKRMEEKS